MTLSFSTKWGKQMGDLAGQPNYFVEKIWRGLFENNISDIREYVSYSLSHLKQFNRGFDISLDRTPPKLHTIRHDSHDRWKAGNKIHFVINNRTKDRFQFAPVVEVKRVQKISIINKTEYPTICENTDILVNDGSGSGNRKFRVYVDDKALHPDEISELARNDGFENVFDFFRFFNDGFTGKIIHWTNKTY